mmetsp:Transcript_67473/g.166671  ORF Transcript_67473/g.166671 Transcript_67473/m.166671 type:complete len:141 (+) Transcript_67473:1014-1436(+)
MGEGVSRDQIKGAKSLDQSSSNKVYKKMMCLLVTGSIRNVGKEGDNLLLMKAKDPEESLCADNKDVFEKMDEDSMDEFREKCPTALGKWKDNDKEADAVLKEWPQDKGDVPKHYALELPEERRGDSQNPDNQSAGVRALT